MNKTWWKEATAYQVYPRSFFDCNGDGMGDLQGVIAKLDYLKDLGIDLIWMSPFFKSPNDDNGYDISGYQEISDMFGSLADAEQLIEEAHKRGIKLIIDLVINHTSDEHPWFVESRSSKDNAKRDWYIWRDGKDGKEPNNWESIFSGSAWELDEATEQYFLHLFSKKMPDLNWENPEVRRALYDMINWWLDKGIDGFRVDAISHIKKKENLPDLPNPKGLDYVSSFDYHMNQDGIHEFLQELKEETFAKYDIVTVGEANGVSATQADEWVSEENGKFNMIFQFEATSLWDTNIGGKLNVVKLKKILTKWQKALEGTGWNALFIENHDKPRIVSTWGNDRELRRESATAFATMYFLMQGTPFIYQGQEIGMSNVKFDSIDDYNDVAAHNLYRVETAKGRAHEEIMNIIWQNGRDNSRTPMQWDDSQNAGFSTAEQTWLRVNPNYTTINVAAQQHDPQSILSFYKQLIALRKSDDVFVYGTYHLLVEKNPKLYVYTRTLGDKTALIVTNLTDKEATYRYAKLPVSSRQLKLANYAVAPHENETQFKLRPFEARVYVL